MKAISKELVIRETKEVLAIVLYLAVSLSLLSTFKALILIQHGIDEFKHDYIVALVEALALGKVVAVAQNMRLLKALDKRALIWSILYKSAFMTLIVVIVGRWEHHLFVKHAETAAHPLLLMFSQQSALMIIFGTLFTVRDLNRLLGPGKLYDLFFRLPEDREKALTSSVSESLVVERTVE